MVQCESSGIQHKVSAVMDRASHSGSDEQMDDESHERKNDRQKKEERFAFCEHVSAAKRRGIIKEVMSR